MSEADDVIVVGAGVAGLSAARTLADAGLPVTLLEAGRDIGGAARPGWITGDGDSGFLSFLGSARTREGLLRPVRGLFVGARGALRPAPREGALPPRLWRSRLRLPRLRRLLRPMRASLSIANPERAERFDDRSVEALGRLYLGRHAATEWLAPWMAIRAPCDPRQTSRVAALLTLSSRSHAALRALEHAPRLDDIRWTEGVSLHCTSAVDGVDWEAGLRVWSRGRACPARAVVLALPLSSLRSVGEAFFTRAQRRALDALCEHRPTTGWWRIAGERDSSAADELWSLRVAPSRSASVAALYVDRARAEVRAALRPGASAAPEALTRHLETLLPGLSLDAASARFETNARPRFDVGAYRAIRRARRLAAELPRVFLAGEAWSESTLEGAAQTGRRAAREVIDVLRRG